MTEQLAGQLAHSGTVRLEISPPECYARAPAYVDGSDGADPARVEFPEGCDRAAADEVAAASAGAPDEPVQPPTRRRAYYPLRRRGRAIREAKRGAYLSARTPRTRLAAAMDYARSAATTARERGMSDDPHLGADLAAALHAATTGLVAAGDALTDAMHTWSPTP